MSNKTLEMMGKTISVEISQSAKKQLRERVSPLFVEMELYFSCLLRKEIRVRETLRESFLEEENKAYSVKLSDLLHVSFRPVMTKSCSVSSCDGEKPPLSDFPIQKPQSYIPKWLKLDFKKGEWVGDFGY